jgi:hypothetical protein
LLGKLDNVFHSLLHECRKFSSAGHVRNYAPKSSRINEV